MEKRDRIFAILFLGILLISLSFVYAGYPSLFIVSPDNNFYSNDNIINFSTNISGGEIGLANLTLEIFNSTSLIYSNVSYLNQTPVNLFNIIYVPENYSTISEAINFASPGDAILVAPGIYNVTEALFIDKNLTLRSRGNSSDTIIQRDPLSPTPHRVLFINGSQANPFLLYVTVEGFTFRHGYSNITLDGSGGVGGNILIESAVNAIIKNSIIEHGTADQYGGGILLSGGGKVMNSIIQHNYVTDATSFASGGGISMRYGGVVMENCLVINNSAKAGGGLQIQYSNSTYPAIVNHSVITNNTARVLLSGFWSGGGIASQLQSAKAYVIDSILYGNYYLSSLQDLTQVHLGGNNPILVVNYSLFNVTYPSDPTGSNNSKEDPLFLESGNNPLDYYSLQSSSPAKSNASDGGDIGLIYNNFADNCIDLDGDGYDLYGECGPIDCNDANPNISPGQEEVFNGIDDNCNGLIDENLSKIESFQVNLTEGEYFWRFLLVDRNLNENATLNQTLVIDISAPILGIPSVTPSVYSATISIINNESTNLTIYYGTNETNLSNVFYTMAFTAAHSISLSSLVSEKVYYYNFSSCDRAGNCNQSANYNFTTLSPAEEQSPSGSSRGYAPQIYYTDEKFPTQGNNFNLRWNDKIRFVVQQNNHTLTMQNFNSTHARVKIESDPLIVWVEKDILYEFDLNNDGTKDVRVRYDGINQTTRQAMIFIQKIVYPVEEDSLVMGDVEDGERSLIWLCGVIGIIAFIILVYVFLKQKSAHKKSSFRKPQK